MTNVRRGDGEQPLVITESHAPKRPKVLECDVHHVQISSMRIDPEWDEDHSDQPMRFKRQAEKYLVLVGMLNGRPYELFAGLSDHVEVPKKTKKAFIVKNGKKDGVATYNLRIPLGDDDDMLLKDVVSLFDNPEHGALTRVISMSLRHGVPMQYVVEQLKKDKRSDLWSFSTVIARVLKNYIPDGTKATIEKKCPECGNGSLVYQGGCISCSGGTLPDGKACSWSKCG